jgi:hypothetical protein
MAKTQRKPAEERPGGWERFERAVDAAVKSGPKHRAAARPTSAPKKPKGN